jgi:arylsulfatase A-like enzyme
MKHHRIKKRLLHIAGLAFLFMLNVERTTAAVDERPNIILVFADDISARELPIYGSSVWSKPSKGDTSDRQYLAKTPVLDQLAKEGCWVKTAWASVVCSPSRAMMMTGRYAHLHKWWANSYKGRYRDASGKVAPWPFYESCPEKLMGHFAQRGGYGTFWAGKTQVPGDLSRYGFQQGCFTPGNLSDTDNPYADFKMVQKKVDGQKIVVNVDNGKPYDTYPQHGWYFNPHVRLMNLGNKKFQWWPNTLETQKSFGIGTYGPDVELDHIFDFMERQHRKREPFFVYHTTHLGHGAFDWLNPENGQCWPGTPVIQWDGKGYTRTEPNITGDEGEYDTHGTVTENGIHTHIEYLDYQMWQYRNKLNELGIADNTVVIFCADNGSSGYGKNSADRQKGVHVPLIIYAPGMTKQGEQDVLVNMSDMLPTIAELVGVSIPDNHQINGESLVPFLYTDKTKHRDWIYGYKEGQQIIRGTKVMRDGFGKWWDVTNEPEDLIGFSQIADWDAVSSEHRAERDVLLEVLPRFDLFDTEPDAPGVVDLPPMKNKKFGKSRKNNKRVAANAATKGSWSVVFNDDFEQRDHIGGSYATARGHDDSWSVVNGVLVGKQTKDDHGAVIRTEVDFDDVDIQFDFRFNGGKSFNLVIDDKNESSVHAGHICRASIFPKRLIVRDDKTGAMNLDVRKQRKEKDLSTEDSAALTKLLAETQSAAKVDLQANQWHTLRIRIKGNIMKAFLDGELATNLRSPGFDHATKTKLGFTVNGQSIEFDNFVVKTWKGE